MATDHRGRDIHAGKRTDDELHESMNELYAGRKFETFPPPKESTQAARAWVPYKAGWNEFVTGPNTPPPAGTKTQKDVIFSLHDDDENSSSWR